MAPSVQAAGTPTPLQAAQEYERRGWRVVPIPCREKAPVLPAWQNLRLGADDLARHFPALDGGKGPGIGVLLGAPSAGLLDVDLDWRVAALLGAHLLPATPAIFGRKGKPRSHYLYVVQPAEIPEPQQYRAPRTATGAAREEKDMVCELRASGQQTVFPPSIHESGEPICWHGNPAAEPALVDPLALRRATELVAAAALLVPHWRAGQRNHMQMALAGALLRGGWTVEQTGLFVAAIAAAGGDADSRTKEKTQLVVNLTARKIGAGEEVTGWPTIADAVDDEPTMRRLGAWLRLPATATSGGTGTRPTPDGPAPKEPKANGNGNGHGSQEQAKEALANRGVWVLLSEVKPERVEWLWPQRIPRGKLTLIGGDPGVGKSFLLLALLTHVTRGWNWPDGQPCPGPFDCILLCGEDGLADTVRPRVDALGGDPARVHPFQGMRLDDGTMRGPILSSALDIAEIERKIGATGARMVLIDPTNTYLDPKLDTFKGPPVRTVTTPLAGLAERTGVAVVLVCHLTKATLQQALYRMPGSVDFVAAARSVLAVGYDPESDAGRRLLLPVKNNLSAHAPGLGFNIIDGALRWDTDDVSCNAAAMLGGGTPHANGHNGGDDERAPHVTKAGAAADLLQLMLGNRPHRANEVYAATAKAGLSKRTVDSAKKALSVVSTSRKDAAGVTCWWWSLPATAAVPPDAYETYDSDSAPDTGVTDSIATCNLASLESGSDRAPISNDAALFFNDSAGSAQDQEACKIAGCNGQCSDCGAPLDRAYGRCSGCRERAYAAVGIDDIDDVPF